MTQEMSEYLTVSAKITGVYAEYHEKLRPLIEAEDALRKELFALTHDLEELQDKYAKSIKNNGERILRQIDRILTDKYGGWYNVFEYASAFGVEILYDPDEEGADQCGMTLRCRLRRIGDITDDYVAFKADTSVNGDYSNYSCGVVHIPMEYFTTDCLDDDAYLSEIFGKLQELGKLEERKNKELQVKEIEQQILELQGKLKILREDLKEG